MAITTAYRARSDALPLRSFRTKGRPSAIAGMGVYAPEKVVTNIVIFDVAEIGQTADAICAQLRGRGVLASGFGSFIRMVTHCDVARADIETALSELRGVLD